MSFAVRTAIAVAVRLPAVMLPLALLAAVVASSGSLLLAGAAAAVALLAAAVSPLVSGSATARHGIRPVLLVLALLHVTVLVLLSAALERLRTHEQDIATVLFATGLVLAAGLTVPPAAEFTRSQAWAAHLKVPEAEAPARTGQRTAAVAKDLALILGAGLVGMLSAGFGGSAGLLGVAALATVIIPVAVREGMHGALPTAHDGEPRGRQDSENAVETLTVPFPALEHARQILAESRGWPLERADEPSAAGPPVPGGWVRALLGQLVSAGSLGLVLGGVWVTLLGLGWASGALGLLGLGSAGVALAAASSSRWLPLRFSGLDGLRRRRLFSVLAAITAAGLLPTAALVPPTMTGQLVVAGCATVLGTCLGVLVVELHAVVAVRVPTVSLHQGVSAVGGAVLCGLALGMTTAGLAAEEIGRGWSALPVMTGGLVLAALTLRRRG